MANWADFVRAGKVTATHTGRARTDRSDVLYEHGGIGLDLDAITLKDVTPLLNSGFRNILARDSETQCGVILAAPRSRLIRAYRDLMDGAYTPASYAFHATTLLHDLRATFVRIPGELLMLSDRSFYPVSWQVGGSGADAGTLWSIRKQNMTHGATQEGDLESFDYDQWIKEYVPPRLGMVKFEGPFDLDFSETYILHVYHSQLRPQIEAGGVQDFTGSIPSKLSHGLTLPLVLEGNSHFARAVLHILWDAIAKGVISEN